MTSLSIEIPSFHRFPCYPKATHVECTKQCKFYDQHKCDRTTCSHRVHHSPRVPRPLCAAEALRSQTFQFKSSLLCATYRNTRKVRRHRRRILTSVYMCRFSVMLLCLTLRFFLCSCCCTFTLDNTVTLRVRLNAVVIYMVSGMGFTVPYAAGQSS